MKPSQAVGQWRCHAAAKVHNPLLVSQVVDTDYQVGTVQCLTGTVFDRGKVAGLLRAIVNRTVRVQ